jgi:hypothetical protein
MTWSVQAVTIKCFKSYIPQSRKKFDDKLTDGITLLHNNAHSCVAHKFQAHLNCTQLEVLKHPTNSPGILPHDFHVF